MYRERSLTNPIGPYSPYVEIWGSCGIGVFPDVILILPTLFDLEFGCRVPKGRSQVRNPLHIGLEFYREYLCCLWGYLDSNPTSWLSHPSRIPE